MWRQTERPVASAVASEDLVFVGSGFRGSFLVAFRPDGTGDIAERSTWFGRLIEILLTSHHHYCLVIVFIFSKQNWVS